MNHEQTVGIITVLAAILLVGIALFPGNNLIGAISSKITELPTQPQLIYPADADNSLTTTPNFQWTMSKHADKIILYVDDESGFSSPLVVDQSFRKNERSYTLPAGILEPGKTYYWRVSAYNAAGATNSDTYSFTVSP